MRDWELYGEVAGFVKKALPPRTFQPRDQDNMKKIVPLVGGQEHLLQASVCHGGREVPQKTRV